MVQSRLSEKRVRDAAGCISAVPEICAAFLVGSAASGRLRKDSDADIALLPGPRQSLSLPCLFELAAELERILGRQVDIGILTPRNLVYAKEAIAGGRRLFVRDKFYTDLFVAQTLSMYADLLERRKEVAGAYAA